MKAGHDKNPKIHYGRNKKKFTTMEKGRNPLLQKKKN